MPTAMATAITPCPAAGGRAADLPLFPRRLAQPQPKACIEAGSPWVGKLASHSQAAQQALGTAGRARGSQKKQIKSSGNKLSELGGKWQRCGFGAGSLHPCKGLMCPVTRSLRPWHA